MKQNKAYQDREQQIVKGTRSIWNEKYKDLGILKWFTKNIIVSLSTITISSMLAITCGFLGLSLVFTVPLIASTLFLLLVIADKILISNRIMAVYKAAKAKYPEINLNNVMYICQDLV